MWQLVKQLKPATAIGLVVLWNVIAGVAIFLNHGLGPVTTPSSAVVTVVLCAALAAACLATRNSKALQARFFRTGHDEQEVRSLLLSIAVVAILLVLGFAWSAYNLLGHYT